MPNRVKITELRKADIIVSTGDSKVSKGIREATGSDVSHAILYTGNQSVIEAVLDGVLERTWEQSRIVDGEMTLAIALRRRNMNNAARNRVVEEAQKFKGLPYDKVGAAGSGMFGNRRGNALGTASCLIVPILCVATINEINENAKDENADKKFFCSELVTRAFTAAGYPIVDGKATWQTPRTVRMSSSLMYVGHLIGGNF